MCIISIFIFFFFITSLLTPKCMIYWFKNIFEYAILSLLIEKIFFFLTGGGTYRLLVCQLGDDSGEVYFRIHLSSRQLNQSIKPLSILSLFFKDKFDMKVFLIIIIIYLVNPVNNTVVFLIIKHIIFLILIIFIDYIWYPKRIISWVFTYRFKYFFLIFQIFIFLLNMKSINYFNIIKNVSKKEKPE